MLKCIFIDRKSKVIIPNSAFLSCSLAIWDACSLISWTDVILMIVGSGNSSFSKLSLSIGSATVWSELSLSTGSTTIFLSMIHSYVCEDLSYLKVDCYMRLPLSNRCEIVWTTLVKWEFHRHKQLPLFDFSMHDL